MIASKNEKLILYLMKQLYLERLNLCEILLCSIRNAISYGSTRPRKNGSSHPITINCCKAAHTMHFNICQDTRAICVLSITVVAISMCNVRKIASLYLSNTPTITLDNIKTGFFVSGLAQQNS